jgi:ankyrin repeat protein
MVALAIICSNSYFLLPFALVQANPSNIDSQLMAACREVPPSINKIMPLVQASPSSVRAHNKDGELPLHIACLNGASLM